MIKSNFVDRIAQSDIGRKLRAQATFTPAVVVSGSFTPDDLRDYRRLHRTSSWVLDNTKGLWRRTLDQIGGRVTFAFEDAGEAAMCRRATRWSPLLIRCV